jgi:phosphohistidine phosphatase
MMHLVLIRHAETAEKVTGGTDKDRELTTSGMRQAASAGHFLKNQSVPVDVILTSGAARAQTTAQLISEQLNSDADLLSVEDELYQASVGTLFEMLRNGDHYHNVAIVGHNPSLSYFSEFISDSDIEEMKPATVLIFKLDIGNWQDLAKGSATLLDRFDA